MLIRKIHIITIFIICVCIIQGYCLKNNLYPNEKIAIDTDRDIYFISDQIWFMATTLNDSNIPEKTSSVIYVELIDKNGKALAQQTLLNRDGIINGYFTVPDTVSSGLCYLRAYSNYMKNFPAEKYAHKFVQLIHPGKIPELQEKAQNQLQNWQTLSNQPIKPKLTNSNQPKIIVSDNTPHQQKEVTVKIENIANDIDIMWCSISAKTLHFPENVSSFLDTIWPINNSKKIEQLHFKPEINFFTVKGKINKKYPDVQNQKEQILMFLSDESPHYYTANLKESNQFTFDIPITDLRKKEVVLQAIEADSIDQVVLSPAYDERIPAIDMNYFYFDSTYLSAYDNSLIQWQLELVHRRNYSKNISYDRPDSIIRFYNPTQYHINPEEYHLEFQSPKELYHEIGRRVKIKGNKDNYSLDILHNHTNNPIGDNPLILIDGYPVTDINQVMRIPVKNIKYFEIVDTPFSINKTTYHGVLQVVTKKFKRDVPVPPNAYRTVYPFFAANAQFQQPKQKKAVTIPFIKNTLYWNSQMKNVKSFSFNTGQNSGKYLIQINGFKNTGENFYSETEIEIRPQNK